MLNLNELCVMAYENAKKREAKDGKVSTNTRLMLKHAVSDEKRNGHICYEMQDHTAESFIEMAKQRLCEKTEKRTRDFMWDMVETLKADKKHPFLQAVGYCCHPSCWWFNGKCPEIKSCHEGVRKLSDCIISQYKEDNND